MERVAELTTPHPDTVELPFESVSIISEEVEMVKSKRWRATQMK